MQMRPLPLVKPSESVFAIFALVEADPKFAKCHAMNNDSTTYKTELSNNTQLQQNSREWSGY
jgi:hypothetical protein